MEFDRRLLRPVVGLRAIWLLYRRGKWGLLEDLGVDRATEPMFEKLESEVGYRISQEEAYKLALIPGVSDAVWELRLAYLLKYYEKWTQEEEDDDEVLPRRSQNRKLS